MLLAFRGQNIRSFREEFALELLPTALAEQAVVRQVQWRSGGKPVGVLPAAAIYGANGSGKSNVLRALYDMRSHVLFSFRQYEPGGGFPRRAFRLGEDAAEPSRYEIDLVVEGVRHEYGFVVDDERVLEEWAIHYPQGRASLLFERTGDEVKLGASIRSRARATAELLRPNALFLSADAAVRQPALSQLSGWFARNLILAEADSRSRRQALTAKMLEESSTRESVLDLLRAADLGISGANRVEMDLVVHERFRRALRILEGAEAEPEPGTEEGPEFESFQVRLEHKGPKGPVEFETDEESLGTLVWFGLVGPILQSLERGSVLLADELDSSLHPDLVAALVALYQDPSINRRRAQLVFNLHDATLLGRYGGKPIILRSEFAEAVARVMSGGSR
jgi:hypothetical protein